MSSLNVLLSSEYILGSNTFDLFVCDFIEISSSQVDKSEVYEVYEAFISFTLASVRLAKKY